MHARSVSVSVSLSLPVSLFELESHVAEGVLKLVAILLPQPPQS